MRTKLHDVHDLGQSIWIDFMSRELLAASFQDWIDRGLRGATSNPSIFDKAISTGREYDDEIGKLADAGHSAEDIYQRLAIDDIRRACDLMRPVYDDSDGADGFVSLEPKAQLAHLTEATIERVEVLHDAVDRPNLMIKIPATEEGLPAIRASLAKGINVNITLIFSLQQYQAVVEAFLSGLEDLAQDGGDLSRIASVASVFVSRLDTKMDQRLDGIGNRDLKGKIGIANAKLIYQQFKTFFASDRWRVLADQGALVQRVLYASTSTKNPAFPDTMYVDGLIGPHTVNTLPPKTIDAFLDHGTVASTLDSGADEAGTNIARLDHLGIDLDRVMDELLTEGVDKFNAAYTDLIKSIEGKRRAVHSSPETEEV
jgi:transaldolase